MSGPPLVSIVIPVRNGAGFLAEGIRSVLAQAHRPIEIVVVDDGSTDDSAAIAESLGAPVRVFRQANAGAPAARNRGIGLACGSILGFLDADDLYAPDKLALQLARLESYPDRDVVIGRSRYLSLVDDGLSERRFAVIEEDHVALQLGTALFRREVFDRVGWLDESLLHCDDWDWFMRAREAEVALLLHRHVVLEQRLHGGNLTRDRAAGKRYQMMMFKRSLDRRRARGGVAVSLPPLSSFREPADG
ncbi:MAG: hypothetical protein RL698_547 [Pseudomonadota bacterium]